MASRTVEIIVKVTDLASDKLKKIEQSVNNLGNSAKSSASGLTNLGNAANAAQKGLGTVSNSSKTSNATLSSLGNAAGAAQKTVSTVGDSAKTSAGGLTNLGGAASAAQRPLAAINGSAKNANDEFTKLNKILFTSTALFGIFKKFASGIFGEIEEAASVDTITNQFENVIGPRGQFIKDLDKATSHTVDVVSSMTNAITLGRTGVVKNSKDTATLFAQATALAMRAGKTSKEGIDAVTDAILNSNFARLQEFGVMRKGDPLWKAQNAILGKAGGLMSGVVISQRNMNLIMQALHETTKDTIFSTRTLADSVLIIKDRFRILRTDIGAFIGKALAPLMDKFGRLTEFVAEYVHSNVLLNKNFQFLAKALVTATIAAAGLYTVFGLLRLATLALGSLSLGIPKLIFFALTLALSFESVRNSLKSTIDWFERFSAIARGVWELVTSFLDGGENFQRGVGFMDKSLAEFLQKNHLLNLTLNIAKVTAVIAKFGSDVGQKLVGWIKIASDSVENFTNKILKLLGLFQEHGLIPRSWIDSIGSSRKLLVDLTASAIVAYTALKGFSLAKGFLSKIPLIGGFFGGGDKGGKFGGPKGTKSEPIYIRHADAARELLEKGFFKNFTLKGLSGVFKGQLGSMVEGTGMIAGTSRLFKTLMNQLKSFKVLRGLGFGARAARSETGLTFMELVKDAGGFFRTIFSGFSKLVGPIGSVVIGLLAMWGAVKGVINTTDEWKTFFKGIYDVGLATFEGIKSFFTDTTVGKFISNSLTYIAQSIKNGFNDTIEAFKTVGGWIKKGGNLTLDAFKWTNDNIFKNIVKGWENIFGWLGIGAGKFGKYLSDKFGKDNKKQAQTPVEVAVQVAPPAMAASAAAAEIKPETVKEVNTSTSKVITNNKIINNKELRNTTKIVEEKAVPTKAFGLNVPSKIKEIRERVIPEVPKKEQKEQVPYVTNSDIMDQITRTATPVFSGNQFGVDTQTPKFISPTITMPTMTTAPDQLTDKLNQRLAEVQDEATKGEIVSKMQVELNKTATQDKGQITAEDSVRLQEMMVTLLAQLVRGQPKPRTAPHRTDEAMPDIR